jgi:hypothetical protein
MDTDNKRMIQIVKNHINKNQMDKNSEITMIDAMEHIASCDHCANEFAELITTDSFIKAPRYMKANILEETKIINLNEKKHQRQKNQYSKQLQLITYSLKVGLAMCGCLAVLFLSTGNEDMKSIATPFNPNWPNGANTSQNNEKVDHNNTSIIYKINDNLRDFSNNVAEYAGALVTNNKNLEETDYDKKEK